MDEIKKWLATDHDYDTGVLLFCRVSKNRNLHTYLQRKRDPAKLLYELQKLAGGNIKTIASSIVTPVTTPVDATQNSSGQSQAGLPLEPKERLKILHDGAIRFQDLPQILQDVYIEAGKCYKQMRHFHEKMKVVTTDAERAMARAEVIRLTEHNKAQWAIIDKWANDGTLPESKADDDKEDSSSNPVDGKALTAARTGITRNLTKIDKETDPKKREQILTRLRADIEVIKAAGCDFSKNAERLEKLGLISSGS